ncbi:hypothetical protein HPB49_020871 [Dermacentor silvarum]|uniref:Uncharacterized protein n=1 Tax=Dermacentor silvarum TaxID=543639 RepID=A0ACB8E3C1_DERSI|nr:hypothetical protein HPB49_020871 [Dermacentor silvarum]
MHCFHIHAGDSACPLEPWLLTPARGHPPIRKQLRGSTTLHMSPCVPYVERCIRFLKSRFRCLQRYRTLLYKPERAANIIAACAVLHNLRLSERDVEDDDESDDDSSSSSRNSELVNDVDLIPHGLS